MYILWKVYISGSEKVNFQEMMTYWSGIHSIESLSSGMQLWSSLQSKSLTLYRVCTCLQHYLSRGFDLKGQTAIGYLIDYYTVVFLVLRGIEIDARPKQVFWLSQKPIQSQKLAVCNSETDTKTNQQHQNGHTFFIKMCTKSPCLMRLLGLGKSLPNAKFG